MAYIQKRKSGKYQVRWTDPDKRERGRTFPTHKHAKRFSVEVEACVASGRRWLPEAVRDVPDLEEVTAKYLEHRRHRLRGTTLRRYTENLRLFERFLRLKRPAGALVASILTRPILEDFYVWLMKPDTSHLGRARSKNTARKIVEVVQLMWRWADESDRWPGRVPRPRRIEMPRDAPRPPTAPTWAEMDACIAATKTEWITKLLTFLRFTGLRVGETMMLRWSDLDLERGLLTIEPSITKNKRGRIIPLSPHLLDQLNRWRRDTVWLIPSPPGSTDRARQPRPRDVALAWREAGVAERVWRGSPHHALRKGFKSGMLRAEAPPDAVDHLQGHVISGSRGRYIDPMVAYDLGSVVMRVPAASYLFQ